MLSEELESALGERWGWNPRGNARQSVVAIDHEMDKLHSGLRLLKGGLAKKDDLESESGAEAALKAVDEMRAMLKRLV